MISRAISQSEARTRVFTVSKQNNSVLQTAKLNKSVKSERKSNSELMATNSKNSTVYIQANYEKDKQFQKSIRLLQNRDSSQIARLPPPWREKLNSLSLDSNNLLYLAGRELFCQVVAKRQQLIPHLFHFFLYFVKYFFMMFSPIHQVLCPQLQYICNLYI